ncbi:MAG TPA: Flp family type IVb pilin [Gemmataceae bacterium]|nr:Flp family type IVb pilin [Gemmataceae bacterium]
MAPCVRRVVRFLAAEDGPTAVEYAIMLALLILVCFVAIGSIGTQTNSMLGNVNLRLVLGGGS